VDELLALLGQNWRLLLVYPGGLTAFAALVVITFLDPETRSLSALRPRLAVEIVIAAAWLLLIALLPPPQTGWPYALDLLTLALLIELPYWWYTLRRAPNRISGLAAALNVYPLLALAIATLGQGAGSLVVREINRSTGWLHWLGVAAWAIALPPLLAIGPWRGQQPTLLDQGRRVAHTALLLALALPANDGTPIWTAAIGVACIALPLATLNRWWHGDGQRSIAWQPWLVGALALVLAVLSMRELGGRLG
jgi:hypothetical protein